MDEEGAYQIAVNAQSGTKNTIQNVGESLAALLSHDNTIKQVIKISDGFSAINDTLQLISVFRGFGLIA